MTAVPLGQGAYKRLYAGAPEVKLLNRWLEANPANPREGTSILARPGISYIQSLSSGTYYGSNVIRKVFSVSGLFNNALFVVSGSTLGAFDIAGNYYQISTSLPGTKTPEIGWQSGAGYERLWIADAGGLYYFDSSTVPPAHSTLTRSGATSLNLDKLQIGSTYYQFTNLLSPLTAGNGTSAKPYQILVPGGGTPDPLLNLTNAINGVGIAGQYYDQNIISPNTQVSATFDGVNAVTIKARIPGPGGNSIASIVTSNVSGTLSFGTVTLTGGVNSLISVSTPSSVSILGLATVSGYVLASVNNSQQFYWINPGAVTIDSLNFAYKESAPDPIISMKTVGDQVLIMGSQSTENWYATGDSTSPFAPIQGRVYARGVISNTPVVVDENIILVGNDGRVYSIGYQAGDVVDSGWGVSRISNNGIEERIRLQLKSETNAAVTRQPCWTFAIDGHRFYVLSLGPQGDWAYDTTTHEWSQLQTQGYSGLNFCHGTMWGTRIMGGDLSTSNTTGLVLELDPNQTVDYLDSITTVSIEHIVTGGLPTRSRNAIGVSNFTLTASVGDDASTSVPISLAFSDDNGVTYSPEFTLPLTNVSTQTLIWNSLGSFSAPGRIFRVTDYGGPVRIDGADCVLSEGSGVDAGQAQEGQRRR